MMALLFDKTKRKRKAPKTKASSSKGNDKEKEGENFTSEPFDGNENNFETENPRASSEESENLETKDITTKRIGEFDKHLGAIAK